jgi:hypothetical protein
VTYEEFRAALESIGDAWRDRRYEDAASHIAPTACFVDPMRYSLSGRDALLAFFRNDGGLDQTTEWHHVLFDETTQIGAAEYSYRGTHLYHGVALIRLEQGRITHWREYQHTAESDWESFFGGSAF